MQAADTLSFSVLQNPAKRYANNLPNNAYFLAFRRYQSKQDELWGIWKNEHHSDLIELIKFMKDRYPFL
jgi:hypothetical protein